MPGRATRKPTAVVVGLEGMNGLQTVRILAGHGVPVIGLARDLADPSCSTRVCERVLEVDIQSEALIDELEALGPTLDQKAVLVPAYDRGVELLSRHRARLEPWFHLPLPSQDIVDLALNKTALYEFAMSRGLPIPATHFVRSRADLEEILPGLAFPCVLKPPFSADPAWERHSIKAYKPENADQLRGLFERCHPLSETLIVQEWIEGPDSELFSCNAYFDREGEALATFVSRKWRQWPPETGMSSMGVECRDDRVLEIALDFFQSLGHQGLAYLEVKRRPSDGSYFIMEPNVGRPTGRSAIAEAGGVDLLYTMYCDLVGAPLPEGRTQSFNGVKWIHLRKDTQASLHYWRRGELSARQWFRSLMGKKAFALFSLSDPLPFVRDAARSLPSMIFGDGGRDPRDLMVGLE